jgi:hypothetical protein
MDYFSECYRLQIRGAPLPAAYRKLGWGDSSGRVYQWRANGTGSFEYFVA